VSPDLSGLAQAFFIFIPCNPFVGYGIYPIERVAMIIKLGPNMSEKQLIAACKRNERRAQQQLFDEQAPIMLSVCRRYLKDADLAEEVMLQGFVKVFEKIGQFKSEGSFQGWIRKIMVNSCLGWIRKHKEMYKEVELDSLADVSNPDRLEGILEADDLMRLIEDLPQGYRTIFNLYAIEGYTHDEIAIKLDISAGTSKSQLSRARKYLQGQLASLESSFEQKKQQDGI
jgi:RNA polymerase sigma factor (sigma-70 family)